MGTIAKKQLSLFDEKPELKSPEPKIHDWPKFELLLKLADHLMNGELQRDGYWKGLYELPYLFPESWHFLPIYYHRFTETDRPGLKEYSTDFFMMLEESACKFFNLTHEQYVHLFLLQDPETFGGKRLGRNYTPEDVANNIIIFCGGKAPIESTPITSQIN